MLTCWMIFIQESSSRSIRGADGQAAAKSSLADIEKRKKGIQQSSRNCTDNLWHQKEMFQKKSFLAHEEQKNYVAVYACEAPKNLMHTFLSQFRFCLTYYRCYCYIINHFKNSRIREKEFNWKIFEKKRMENNLVILFRHKEWHSTHVS